MNRDPSSKTRRHELRVVHRHFQEQLLESSISGHQWAQLDEKGPNHFLPEIASMSHTLPAVRRSVQWSQTNISEKAPSSTRPTISAAIVKPWPLQLVVPRAPFLRWCGPDIIQQKCPAKILQRTTLWWVERSRNNESLKSWLSHSYERSRWFWAKKKLCALVPLQFETKLKINIWVWFNVRDGYKRNVK